MEQKIYKKIFLAYIIAFESGVANSCNVQQDTWHQQAMRQQTHQRFHLALKERFSKSTSLGMMKKHEKSALIEILEVLGILSHVDWQSVF